MESQQEPARLVEKLAVLRSRVKQDVWDTVAWEAMAAEVTGRTPAPETLGEQRKVFEEILAQFPTAGFVWKNYAEAEMAVNNQPGVKAVFSRCLLDCLSVDLWRTYLKFIKKVNEGRGPDGVLEVCKAYEYTLDKIGGDIDAGQLWQEYINFLQAPRPGSPAYAALYSSVPGQEDAQRATLLRRAYHRALAVPVHGLEAMWRAYEQFENTGGNKQFAQKAINEMRSRYQAARTAYAERRRKLEPIALNALAVPPGKGGEQQRRQLQLWRDYIAWEAGNPQRLDGPALAARVALAYDQALMVLLHFPDMWHDHARWQLGPEGGGADAAALVLERACKALPECTMLSFAAADLEESRGDPTAARRLYEELVAPMEAAEEDQPPQGEAQPAARRQVTAEAGSLIWIQYMRFARRAESLQASRKVFMRARRWKDCSWQVYAESALVEWRSEKSEKVSRNIFELGLRAFLTEPQFVITYVEFLVGLGDSSNARALFERALVATPPNAVQPLWDAYLRFEYENCASLAAVASIEARRAEALAGSTGAADSANLLLLRYRVAGLWPCTPEQRDYYERMLGLVRVVEVPMPAPMPSPPPAGQQAVVMPAAGVPAPASPRPASAGPPPAVAPYGPPPASPLPPAAAQGPVARDPDIKQLPAELGLFINALPPPQALDGPSPDTDLVISLLMRTDLSEAAAVAADQPGMAGGRAATPPAQVGSMQQAQHPPQAPGMGQARPGGHGGYPTASREQGTWGQKRKLPDEASAKYAAWLPGSATNGSNGADQGMPVGDEAVHDIFRMRRKQRSKAAGGEG